MIEVWFGIIERQTIHRGTFSPVHDVNTKIRAFITGCNDRCRHFVTNPAIWCDPDQLLASSVSRNQASRVRSEVSSGMDSTSCIRRYRASRLPTWNATSVARSNRHGPPGARHAVGPGQLFDRPGRAPAQRARSDQAPACPSDQMLP